MKKKLLRTLPLVAFTLAFAIIFGADLYMSFHLRTLIERSRLVTRTLQVRGKLDETLQLLTDLETAPRGYVITGQEEFLEPYFAALAPEDGIKKHINELRQLSATNPAQQAYLDMLEPLIARKIAFVQQVVRLRRERGLEAAQTFIASDVGRQTMDKIRRLIADMKLREDSALLHRYDEASISMRNTINTMTTSAALSLSLLLLSFVILNREIKIRRRTEEALQQLNSSLEERVQERTRELLESAEHLQAELERRIASELKVRNISRMYATLSQVNQTIVRTKDKEELYRTICRVAVEYGRFGLAWIGALEAETGLVTPKVVYGAGEHDLPFKTINIHEAPFQDGIIGTAITSGKVTHTRNIQTDPKMQQWREMAIAGGYHSAASLPIRQNGTVVVVMNLYASEVDFFIEEELRLLEEMAMDLSFALDNFDREAQRERSKEALKRSEARFRMMFENHSAIMMILDPESGAIIDANRAAAEFYGWPIEVLRRMKIDEINTLTTKEVHEAMSQNIREDKSHFFFRHRRANGSVRDVEVYSRSIEMMEKLSIYTIVHDVTDRVHYEKSTAFHLLLLEISESRSVEELLQMTLDEAERQTESSIGFFHFVTEDQTTLSLQAWSTNTIKHMCQATGEGRHYDLDQAGVWADAVRERKAVIHNDYSALTGRKGMPEGHAEVRREVVVPVLRAEKVVAILGVGNKLGAYDESDSKWVSMLADIAWDIVAKKIAEEEKRTLKAQQYVIEKLAMHDSLTGLPNRRLLSDRIRQALALSQRSHAMGALMIFDLDKFKIVNDTFGHALGDLLLQEVAKRTLGSLQRSSDSLARLGGDEFVVLLPTITAVANSLATAEKIRLAIEAPFFIEGHQLSISSSIGIAVFPDHGEDELTLMKHADQAMYLSKNKGRNCVTLFGGEAG